MYCKTAYIGSLFISLGVGVLISVFIKSNLFLAVLGIVMVVVGIMMIKRR